MKTSKFSTSTDPTVPYAKATEFLNTLFPTSKRPFVTYPTGDFDMSFSSFDSTCLSLSSTYLVSPESVVIPIVTCIFGFPLVAFIVICCLRKRAKLARERDRLNYGLQEHAVSLVRFNPIHNLSEYLVKHYLVEMNSLLHHHHVTKYSKWKEANGEFVIYQHEQRISID